MRNLILMCFILMLLASCNVEPRAIRYGEEVCHHCKMKLMDPHFGAEVLTQKGKIFIFDDVNCLMTFLKSEEVPEENIKKILVADYHTPETLIEATDAFFLKSDQFKTPMASNTAAFKDEEILKEYETKNGGKYLSWGELLTQFK